MDRKELIKKYIEFFKNRGHKEIKNSSLIPENDPTVLFTTAGMHPLVPFLLGEKHPLGKKLCNVQRCIRTGDIDEVGDTYHHTFFEMLGNWSLGDYFKEEAIKMTFEFQTKVLGIPVERYAVTCFKGNENSEKDEESAKIWESLGIKKDRIAFLGKDNWWGPAGNTGPCGPCTEQFYWKPNNIPAPKKFDPEDNRWIEIGNDVLMQYVKDTKGNYNSAKQKNIDFGGGVERMIAVLNGLEDNYLADMWKPIIEKIELISGEKYEFDERNTRAMRIIADHIKAAVFIINDGIVPSNSEQGYVLRRLIRRAIRYAKQIEMEEFTRNVAEVIFFVYDDYKFDQEKILMELEKEEQLFSKTLTQGNLVFERITMDKVKKISGRDAFLLYQSYGFPVEMIEEECSKKGIKFSKERFEKECKIHQELSRTATQGKFKSGLADNSMQTTRLHTTTHLLLAALRIILKDNSIMQKGSNITSERLRLDFNFSRKLTEEEIKKVEELVNSVIEQSCKIVREEMSPKEAKKMGAVGVFDEKYGEKVSVYTIGNFSKEICAGPHVGNTEDIGHFKIVKEEASSSGVRRIKAVIE